MIKITSFVLYIIHSFLSLGDRKEITSKSNFYSSSNYKSKSKNDIFDLNLVRRKTINIYFF